MSKKFSFIINLLIILLIIALVAVMMNYYMNTTDIPTSVYNSGEDKNENINNINSSGNEHLIDIQPIIKDNTTINHTSGEATNISGEKQISGEVMHISGENQISGDVIDSNGSGEIDQKPKENLITKPEDKSPFIITSENDISSKEKQEILTEIDRTLTELLEVVDQVQTVDETRLIVDDSEVQE